MSKKVRPVLIQIQRAIEGIETAVAGKTLDEFKGDWLLKHGVERGIEIISEAARRIPDELLGAHPEIPWPKIKAIGNVLRHEYHDIQDEVVWDVAVDRLRPLRDAIEQMLQSICEE